MGRTILARAGFFYAFEGDREIRELAASSGYEDNRRALEE